MLITQTDGHFVSCRTGKIRAGMSSGQTADCARDQLSAAEECRWHLASRSCLGEHDVCAFRFEWCVQCCFLLCQCMLSCQPAGAAHLARGCSESSHRTAAEQPQAGFSADSERPADLGKRPSNPPHTALHRAALAWCHATAPACPTLAQSETGRALFLFLCFCFLVFTMW